MVAHVPEDSHATGPTAGGGSADASPGSVGLVAVHVPPLSVQEAPIALPSQSGPGTVIDLAGQVKEVGELRDSGVLTDEEFQAAKDKLLGRT